MRNAWLLRSGVKTLLVNAVWEEGDGFAFLAAGSRSQGSLAEGRQPWAVFRKAAGLQGKGVSLLCHDPLKTGLLGRRRKQQRSRERGAFWNRSLAEVDNRRLPEGRAEGGHAPDLRRFRKSRGLRKAPEDWSTPERWRARVCAAAFVLAASLKTDSFSTVCGIMRAAIGDGLRGGKSRLRGVFAGGLLER